REVRPARRPLRGDRAPVPLLPGREPLGPPAAAREGLVPGGARVPRGARAGCRAGRGRRGAADDARLNTRLLGAEHGVGVVIGLITAPTPCSARRGAVRRGGRGGQGRVRARSWARPRRAWLLTVPSGRPVSAATWAWVRSCAWA